MARNKHRVKHYYGDKAGIYRAKPRPVTIIFVALLLVGLAYLGTVIYQPVYDFIMNVGKPPVSSSSETEKDSPEPSSQAVEKEPEPEPEPPRPEFAKLKAVYIPPDLAADPARLDEFIVSIKETALNAVMVDIKNAEGYLLFKSTNAQAQKWGLIAPDAIDLKALAQKLEENGLYFAVKMSAFRDPKAASAGRMDYAINYQDSDFLWLDESQSKGGKPWLNPYSMATQDYLEAIALEAVDAGAKLVVLENVRFPDNSGVYATFGRNAVAMSRSEILQSFMSNLGRLTEEKGAKAVAGYTMLESTQEQGRDDRYGGSPLKIANGAIALNVSPSQFGGDYYAGGLQIAKPLSDPVGAIVACLGYAKSTAGEGVKIIPILQGGNDLPFNENTPYTAEQVAAQIKAAEMSGADEYILYNANARYLLAAE